jgi:hypothetical protein
MKKLHIIGGGTFSHIRCHLSLATPAFGATAKHLNQLALLEEINADEENWLVPRLHLTAMANSGAKTPSGHKLVTNEDVSNLVDELVDDPDTAMIIFNPALCDYEGAILGEGATCLLATPSGKYETRLKSREGAQTLRLWAADKIIGKIRKERKDIFLVAFKTTAGATEDEQYFAGLKLLKENSCNLVLANDVITRTNMVITPEEARYHVTQDREKALNGLFEMAILRYGLTYNRTEIVPGETIPWDSKRIPETLRTIVDYCIKKGAYKPIRGKTVGHFSFKENETKYLVSRRKVNFNRLEEFGVVEVEIDDEYKIKATGAKPSAGSQTQRLIFRDHPQYDCIIHFHCPLRENSEIPVRSQYAFECGSMQCGTNTSQGLKQFGNLSAVMLDQHGPNIVFHHSIDPQEVMRFIDHHCDLSKKTGGYRKDLAD